MNYYGNAKDSKMCHIMLNCNEKVIKQTWITEVYINTKTKRVSMWCIIK